MFLLVIILVVQSVQITTIKNKIIQKGNEVSSIHENNQEIKCDNCSGMQSKPKQIIVGF